MNEINTLLDVSFFVLIKYKDYNWDLGCDWEFGLIQSCVCRFSGCFGLGGWDLHLTIYLIKVTLHRMCLNKVGLPSICCCKLRINLL